MILYLLGIFMGAIDTGIVTPARTVIQNNLLVDEKTGIWMITIYTLAYAASIPIMGKLADMFGRKYIYLASIFLFGLGSLFCGLAQEFNSFTVLLAARIVQALGGGGILPVATAEFGTTFPPEKRGMALGLVGGVYGIANIFGASAGSAILDIFGKSNWQFIFYVNLPITLFILIAGFLCLPNNRNDNVKKIDIGGILILTVMILALMYGLKNIDFFDFKSTLISTSVYPFLTLFGILIPFFILAEKKAEDPVMNLSYFTNSRIMITFIIAFITGIVLMGMIFVPQFAENSLKIASGSGGYFVIILGLFAGVGAPLSGKLIDKYGPKMILGLGFLISLLGSLFLIFVAADQPSMLMVNISLVLMGLGMGFTMGTPLNYMMLENAKDEESNSALAALSLVRSIGTAIAPAVMVGFLAHAGVAVQNNVMNLLPKEVSMPKLPYAQELTTEINEMKSNPMMKNVLATVDMPNFSYLEKIEINMNSSSDYQIPDELMDKIKSSDVTTITENSKLIAGSFFAGMAPDMISNIQTGIQNGIDELTVVESMPQSSVSFRDTIEKMTVLKDAVPGAFDTAKQNYLAEIDQRSTVIESEFQKTLNSGFKQVYLTVTISSLIGLIFLCFYRRKPVNKQG
jgi:EmrB/QacA subfamily drug resistance transporter